MVNNSNNNNDSDKFCVIFFFLELLNLIVLVVMVICINGICEISYCEQFLFKIDMLVNWVVELKLFVLINQVDYLCINYCRLFEGIKNKVFQFFRKNQYIKIRMWQFIDFCYVVLKLLVIMKIYFDFLLQFYIL